MASDVCLTLWVPSLSPFLAHLAAVRCQFHFNLVSFQFSFISMKAETETPGGQYLSEITWPVGGRADVKLQRSDCWFRRLSFIVYVCLWAQIMPLWVFPK